MKVAVLGNGKAGKLIAASISDCIPNPAIITRNNCGKIEFNLNIGNESRICNIYEKNNYNTTDQFDCVFVATKSYQALEALLEIKANISTKTILILIQNGLGLHDCVIRNFRHNPIIAAPMSYGVRKINNNNYASDSNGVIVYGILNNNVTDYERMLLQRILKLNTRWENDIKTELEIKFAVNSIINPLSIIYNCSNGDLNQKQGYRKAKELMAKEIAIVLNNRNITPEKIILRLEKISVGTCTNISSSLSDYRKRKKTEICHMNMHLENLAAKKNIKLQTNYVILAALSVLKVLT